VTVSRPFSPETLGERWLCSSEKIRQMCRKGELSHFRLGKLIRIPANEVERLECQNTASSDTDGNGASLTGLPAFELRLERLTEGSPKLALVQSGGPSPSHSPRG
jgi:excisionase family DNA binding protein